MSSGYKQGRRWAFTVWPNIDDPVELVQFEPMSFMTYGLELCPTTGRVHYQGYCETHKKITEGGLANHFRNEGHVDVNVALAIASEEINSKYVSKDACCLYRWGNPMVQGFRSDLAAARQAILDGQTPTAAEDPMLFHVYGRTIDRMIDERNAQRWRSGQQEVYWLWGPTGCGKTRYVYEKHGRDNVYQWKNTSFENYDFQDIVLLDDFRGEMNIGKFLRLTDPYGIFEIDYKHRNPRRLINSKMYITSDRPPSAIWKDDGILEQIHRRITVIHMGGGAPPNPPLPNTLEGVSSGEAPLVP